MGPVVGDGGPLASELAMLWGKLADMIAGGVGKCEILDSLFCSGLRMFISVSGFASGELSVVLMIRSSPFPISGFCM